MRFNPRREVEYRAQLAHGYLEDAESSLRANNFKGCVQYSQLAAEKAAKAVIATRRTPSWGHDPSPELLEVAKELDSQQEAAAGVKDSRKEFGQHRRPVRQEAWRQIAKTSWTITTTVKVPAT